MNQRKTNIDPLSVRSLLLELRVNGNNLSTATGFIVSYEEKHFLITNWHVLTGRNPETNKVLSKTGGIPDEIQIVHHSSRRLGEWKKVSEELYDSSGKRRWLEHPKGKDVDVVALPLIKIDNDIEIYDLDLSLSQTDIIAQPAMPVSIIGFPFGLVSAGAFPIWKTGHIASDPDLDYNNTPAFLIDATTRGGMSGSPVVLRLSGGYRDSNGNWIISSGTKTKLLGVYSGRIHGNSEIGKVWRPKLIPEILSTS